MRSFNFFGLNFGRKAVSPVAIDEAPEVIGPMEPMYRRDASQAVPGSNAPCGHVAILEKLDAVAASLNVIKGELPGHEPQAVEALRSAMMEKAVRLVFSISGLPNDATSESAKEAPGNDAEAAKDEPADALRARELYEEIAETDEEISRFLDDHWRKLRLLVAMLQQEGVDAKAVGSLLADITERFIDSVEELQQPPMYVKVRELARLAGMDRAEREVAHA